MGLGCSIHLAWMFADMSDDFRSDGQPATWSRVLGRTQVGRSRSAYGDDTTRTIPNGLRIGNPLHRTVGKASKKCNSQHTRTRSQHRTPASVLIGRSLAGRKISLETIGMRLDLNRPWTIPLFASVGIAPSPMHDGLRPKQTGPTGCQAKRSGSTRRAGNG